MSKSVLSATEEASGTLGLIVISSLRGVSWLRSVLTICNEIDSHLVTAIQGGADIEMNRNGNYVEGKHNESGSIFQS